MKKTALNGKWMVRSFTMIGALCAALFWAGFAFGQSPGTFTPTGNLNFARRNHTATKLSNGLILIAGGISGSSVLTTAELYNPLTGTSTDTGNLTSPRELATATLLNDGTVLIAGGYTGSSYLNTGEIYNTSTGTFSAITSHMQKERDSHTATLLNDGTVLIAGGYNGGYLEVTELYHPTTGKFGLTNNGMAKERANHTATLLNDGTVLMAGGINCSTCYLQYAEVYSPSAGNFHKVGNMVSQRDNHSAVLLSSGMVLIAGGYNGSAALSAAELYNPSTSAFTSTGSLHAARELFTATVLGDGTVLTAGGFNLSSYLSSAEIYTPSAGTFATTGSLNTARDSQTATPLNNGTVLIAGGYNGNSLASAEIFSNLLVGYVDPKFVVVGVTYAPPGPSLNTFVNYQKSTFIGTTKSVSNSFMSGDSESVSLTYGFNIPFVGGGTITDTFANASSQTTKNTSSVTMSFQTTTGEETFGTGSYWAPVNDDYDTIWVWLNPALIFSISPNGSLTWNGYGLDKTDQPGMDIVPIELGYLNGHFGAIPPDIQTSLNRAWASKQVFGSGQVPALTSADLAQIAAADPFSVSTYGPTFIGADPPTPQTADFRFTMSSCTGLSSFNYVQAAPSQPANIYTCVLVYTNTSMQAQDITSSYSQTFSTDAAFTATAWLPKFSADLKLSNMLQWTTEEQNTITNSNTSTASLSDQGPPCNNQVQGQGPCIPVYDQGLNEPVQFFIFQDNLYGTFMFAPVNFY